ncbi:MAG: hypothetical protein WCP29_15310 [Acidobacteriota bacterium]
MPFRLNRPTTRFHWSALRGRCRRRVIIGLALLAVAAGYGAYAGQRFGVRGDDEGAFDQVLARQGHALTPPPVHLRGFSPQSDREVYLLTVIGDQHDIMFGLTMLVLRMIATLTVAGIGLVLLTAGSTEWEIRSEPHDPKC